MHLAVQHIQSYMTKAMIRVLKLMQEMREMSKSGRGNKNWNTILTSHWLTMTSESLRVMALGFVKITNQCKEMIKPHHSTIYKQLCSDQNEVTSVLFGDNLGTKLTHDTSGLNSVKGITVNTPLNICQAFIPKPIKFSVFESGYGTGNT